MEGAKLQRSAMKRDEKKIKEERQVKKKLTLQIKMSRRDMVKS